MLGAQAIQAGASSVVVCGGQESMSRAPHAMQMRTGFKFGHATIIDTAIHDGLTDAFHQYHMGITGKQKSIKLKVVFLRDCLCFVS